VIPVWPIPQQQPTPKQKPTKNNNTETKHNALHIEELNRQRIEQQWGRGVSAATSDLSEEETNAKVSSSEGAKKDKVQQQQRDTILCHLFDGKALAVYMVSQSQFIDPLNRRDLTREELLNLDRYLKRNGMAKEIPLVTPAYDAKGVTLSTAGAVADTQNGRDMIRQQTAQNIYDSLFNVAQSQSVNRNRRNAINNGRSGTTITEQEPEVAPAATENGTAQQRQQQQRVTTNNNANQSNGWNFELQDGGDGLLIIDDDENPGLRGNARISNEDDNEDTSQREIVEQEQAWPIQGRGHTSMTVLYSADHIIQRHSGSRAFNSAGAKSGNDEMAFPALPKQEKRSDKVRNQLIRRSNLHSRSRYAQQPLPSSAWNHKNLTMRPPTFAELGVLAI